MSKTKKKKKEVKKSPKLFEKQSQHADMRCNLTNGDMMSKVDEQK
jgi:hypothetical protein